MQLADWIQQITGKTFAEIFAARPPLVRLEAVGGDAPTITYWNADALGQARPSDAAITAALAAPPVVDLVGYAEAARWNTEIAGIEVSGVAVATDDRSKQMIIGARLAAEADGSFTTQWVGSDGNVYPLNAAQVIGISNAVLAHVQACFATFATIKAGITAGTVTTTSQIDAAFAAVTA